MSSHASLTLLPSELAARSQSETDGSVEGAVRRTNRQGPASRRTGIQRGPDDASISISVIVPTYRRPQYLTRCLDALARQSKPAFEIIVVARTDDMAAHAICRDYRTELVLIGRPGVAAAYNAGLDRASGEIVALTDDDSEADADWLEKLARRYGEAPDIAGIGGRDVLPGPAQKTRSVVGRLQWFGRIIGNHHCGCGPARIVDVLKGVNMSFRRRAIAGHRFDETLSGDGAQVGVELGFCLALKRDGATLLYDPAITVRHNPAPRMAGTSRDTFDAASFADAVANVTYLTMLHLPSPRRALFTVYIRLIGTRSEPGMAQSLRLAAEGDPFAWAKLRAARRGREVALARFRRQSAPPLHPVRSIVADPS